MRDICFRGKRKDNGQWEYGLLSYGRDGYEIVNTDGAGLIFHSPIDPQTIGQYTGVKDKNGTEIYEGDILCGNDQFYTRLHGHPIVHIGSYTDDELRNRLLDEDEPVTLYGVHIVTKTGPAGLGQEDARNFTVIGNIYENPELLEESHVNNEA